MCVLTVYAPNDHIDHYGYAQEANVVKVATSSWHEYGTIGELVVGSGKVVIEDTAVVFDLKQSNFKKENGNYVTTAETTGDIIKADSTPTISNNGGNIMDSKVSTVNASDSYEINNYEQLVAFRDATNSGKTFEGMTVNLNCDITLTEAWTPISNYSRNTTSGDTVSAYGFAGTFDGKNHTISGLTNVNLGVDNYISGRNNSTPKDSAEVMFGFFASTNGATIKNIIFTNVNITNDGFGSLLGDSVGACVGFSMGKTTIENITVSGNIEGYDSVAGILGRDKGTQIVVKNCTNNASVFAYQGASGIIGRSYGIYTEDCLIDGCINNGHITSNGTNDPHVTGSKNNAAAGITYFVLQTGTNAHFNVSNCMNTNTVENLHTDINKQLKDQFVVQNATKKYYVLYNCKGE